MDPAVVGLIGVVVGVVLGAGFGAWRDRQERAHQLRAELRTERLAAIAAFLAAVEHHVNITMRRLAVERTLEMAEDVPESARDEYKVALRDWLDADNQASLALSRVRLLSPDLREHAHAVWITSLRDYEHEQDRKARSAKRDADLQAFEQAARKSLGIER